MKKKLLFAGAAILVATATVTGFSVYDKTNVSDLLSANIEALTDGEGHITVGPICVYDPSRICYTIDDDLGRTYIYGWEA